MVEKRDIVARTFEFAVQVVRLGDRVPRRSAAGTHLFSQVVRAGTSIGANVEEAQAGESRADFVHKYGIALKEARETHHWLRLFKASGILGEKDVGGFVQESDEIRRILGRIIVTTKRSPEK